MKNQQIITEALAMFIEPTHPKEYAQKPHIEGDYVFATDGFGMVWIEKSKVQKDFGSLEKPHYSSVIPNYNTESIIINVAKLRKFITMHTKLVDETVDVLHKCPTCDGIGRTPVEDEPLIDEDCCDCEGVGKIDIQKTTCRQIPYNHTRFHDGKAMFSYWQIMRIIALAELAKCKRIRMKQGSNHDPYYYEIGDFKAMMMPIQYDQILMNSCIHFTY
jgi:hypothetical protein